MDDPRDVLFVWQDHCLRAGNTQLRSQGCLEELVVRGPHEGIIDHSHTLEDGILEIEPVIGYLVRDTVNNDGVGARFIHPCAADLNELGDNAFVAIVNFFDEGGREGPFPPDKQTDLQSHLINFLPYSILTVPPTFSTVSSAVVG